MKIKVDLSDLQKIHDAVQQAVHFHKRRDEMNARLHLAPETRYSPLTSMLDAERDRLERLILDQDVE